MVVKNCTPAVLALKKDSSTTTRPLNVKNDPSIKKQCIELVNQCLISVEESVQVHNDSDHRLTKCISILKSSDSESVSAVQDGKFCNEICEENCFVDLHNAVHSSEYEKDSFKELKQWVIQTQSAAKSDGTKANIRSHVNSYLAFSIYYSL